MKNAFKKTIFSITIALSLSFISNAQLQIDKLFCENQVAPLGIDVRHPRLRWTFALSGFDQIQSAYEIKFSESADFKTSWSTDKIISNQNINIEYTGKELQSNTRYHWKVRVYDKNNNPSEWSSISWFETAMVNTTDWKAEWIGDGNAQFTHDEDFYKDDPMPLMRKDFVVRKKIKQARLYAAGLGYCEAYINGKKIGDRRLEPGWTTYSKQVLYSTYDVSDFINNGINTTVIMLGNGWFNPLPLKLFSRFNLRDFQQTGRPCMKAELHIEFTDGTREKIITDNSWLTTPGPVVRNSVYLGERYDARLEKDWFAKPEASLWKNAVIVEGPSGKLTPQMQPPIRVTRIIKPKSIVEVSQGKFIVDMGQNFAGVVKIKVIGARGTEIKLKYGEDLLEDGSLNYLTTVAGQIKEQWKVNGGAGAPKTAWQEDSYILKGLGLEEWSPRFTFHGFRYVEIDGWPGKPDLNSIEGLRMNSDIQSTGEFSCSNQVFNRIHDAVQWTFLSNVFSVQSDCPGREKMGYGADIVATANAFMYNYDMTNFYRKTVNDYGNDQQLDGGITEIAPFTGIADKGYGGYSGPLGWQLAFPYLQYQLYQFYGDKKIIVDNYEKLKNQMEFLNAKSIDGLYHWDIGDHEALDPKAEAFSASCFYYHHALLAKEFAKIVAITKDTLAFDQLKEKIKKDIVSKYYIPGTGRFDNATQSAQLFALWYDLSPEKEKTIAVLLNEFARHTNHVSSGIFGVKMMFDVLRKNSLNELAYEVANQRDFPGWGYMIEKGATTLWETWKYPENAPSQNHPMFGSIDEWFYRSLLGINQGAPGFEKIIIKPQPAQALTWAKGSYQSVKGLIGSNWKIENNIFKITVEIPPNSKAKVFLPSNKKATLKVNGNVLPNQRVTISEDRCSLIEVGSGIYHFEISL